LVAAARDQLGWGTVYDSTYRKLDYPNGDVPKTKGVCTDVVIRAYRVLGFDLQKAVHEDIAKAPADYKPFLTNGKADANIDHRRCPVLMVYLKRHAESAPIDREWMAGDIVFWKLDNGRDHVGLVSDLAGDSGSLKVIHNISQPSEDDVLNKWTIVGHFRLILPNVPAKLNGTQAGR